MSNLAAFRTLVDQVLGSAVDASTWTDAILNEGLRQALQQYDDYFIYEADFTVATTGEAQDMSGITALKEIVAVAYPWSDGADFASLTPSWRYTDDQTVYFETIEPQKDDTIRTRYTKLHVIEDLDSATATTVPARNEPIVALAAGIYCCDIRIRQLSENAAPPKAAINHLKSYITRLQTQLDDRLRSTTPVASIAWSEIGM